MVWGKILPWTNQFETNQLPKRIMKNSRRTWCVRIRKSEFWLSKFLYVYLDAFTNNFPGSHKRSSTPDSCASYRGNHSEPLDRWRTHPPPSVAIEVISWRRTCLPIANELGKEPARWKPPWYIMVQWYSNSTLHLSWCSLDGYYQLHDSWCKTARMLSEFQWRELHLSHWHSATCIAVVSQSFQQRTCSVWKSNRAATNFVSSEQLMNLEVECQDGTSCTDIMWYNVIVVEWYCLMWGCRWGYVGTTAEAF